MFEKRPRIIKSVQKANMKQSHLNNKTSATESETNFTDRIRHKNSASLNRESKLAFFKNIKLNDSNSRQISRDRLVMTFFVMLGWYLYFEIVL